MHPSRGKIRAPAGLFPGKGRSKASICGVMTKL